MSGPSGAPPAQTPPVVGPQHGPVSVLITSDTHGPRSSPLPRELLDAAAAADVVLHAGDWCDAATWHQLDEASRVLVGVAGNNDGRDLHERLPEVANVMIGGLRVVVVHDSGPSAGRERRCARRFPLADVLVFGHSHIPWQTVINNDNRSMHLLNPGSPTEPRRQPRPSYLTVGVTNGHILTTTLHAMPRTTAACRRREQ